MNSCTLHNLRPSPPLPACRLRQLFPRNYGGLKPWVQRLILNCLTIFTCLGVAVAVPGESGTVLTVTGATGGWVAGWASGWWVGRHARV